MYLTHTVFIFAPVRACNLILRENGTKLTNIFLKVDKMELSIPLFGPSFIHLCRCKYVDYVRYSAGPSGRAV